MKKIMLWGISLLFLLGAFEAIKKDPQASSSYFLYVVLLATVMLGIAKFAQYQTEKKNEKMNPKIRKKKASFIKRKHSFTVIEGGKSKMKK